MNKSASISFAIALLLAACATEQTEPTAAAPAKRAESVKAAAAPRVTNLATEVSFAYQKLKLAAAEESRLEEFAARVRAEPGALSITIDAHANERGTDEYRLGIANRRADALKAILVAHGLPADKITTQASPARTAEIPAECSNKKLARKKKLDCGNPASPATVSARLVLAS